MSSHDTMVVGAEDSSAPTSGESASKPAAGHGRHRGLARALTKRVGQIIFVLVGVVVVTFSMLRLIPGDPARLILGKFATPDSVAELRHEMGLDKPILTQFTDMVVGLFQGKLGVSLVSRTQTVNELIGPAFLNTMGVVAVSLAISLVIGISVGIIGGIRRNDAFDRWLQGLMVVLLSTPPFMFGMLLLLLALRTKIAPVGGWNHTPFDSVKYIWLPALALSIALAPVIARSLRQSIRETFAQDFVEAAIARGLPRRQVVLRHVLPNSLLPIVGLIGYSLGGLIGGAVVVEVVFNIPGIGARMMAAVGARDFPVVQGIALVSAVTVIFFNALADAAYWLIDPRTRTAGS
ncbi:MAG: ABC transporter permease [Propionibacteriales bacterium]|nr:ABC transporter permease [Propionibacteriales bacterium]